jgi:flagellar FliJ protein
MNDVKKLIVARAYYEQQEGIAEQAYYETKANCEKKEATLKSLHDYYQQYMLSKQGAVNDPGILGNYRHFLKRLDEAIVNGQTELEQMVKLCEQRHLTLVERKQKTAVVEKLIKKRQNAHEARSNKQEQAMFDAIALQQWLSND